MNTDQVTELQRLHDISTGLHWVNDGEDLLFCCINNIDPKDLCLYDTESKKIPVDRLNDVLTLYTIAAAASVEDLPILAKQRICYEACEPWLSTVMSNDELEKFMVEHRLNDGFTPGVTDIEAALDRVHTLYPTVTYEMLDGKQNESSNDKILQVALGDLKLNAANVQQVYLALQDLFSKLDQGLEIDQSAGDIMPAGTYGLRLACQNYLRRNEVKWLDHGDLSIRQQVVFTS
jgi:hypothetical protein